MSHLLCKNCKHNRATHEKSPCDICDNPYSQHQPITPTETDPTGKSAHQSGAKLDQGKNRLGLVINGFSRALQEVGKVGTFGAEKYTDNGWKDVNNGKARYTDAMYRHLLAEANGEAIDPETNQLHAAQSAWNALARLDFVLGEQDGSARK